MSSQYPARVPELLERVEHRELHVRVDPVDQRHAPVAKVEDDAVLVGLAGRPDHLTRALLEREPAVGVVEPMHADPPELVGVGRRQIRVGHHVVLGRAGANTVHPRVLPGV